MQMKAYREQTKANLPPLMQAGDKFTSISNMEVKTIDYNGQPTELGQVTTDRGVYGTFSGVIIKTLKQYFATNKEPLENVQVVAPRGKKYLALEGF